MLPDYRVFQTFGGDKRSAELTNRPGVPVSLGLRCWPLPLVLLSQCSCHCSPPESHTGLHLAFSTKPCSVQAVLSVCEVLPSFFAQLPATPSSGLRPIVPPHWQTCLSRQSCTFACTHSPGGPWFSFTGLSRRRQDGPERHPQRRVMPFICNP